MRLFLALIAADMRNMRRDLTFGFLLISPFVLGVGLRLLIPAAVDFVDQRFDLSLAAHVPALIAFFLQLPPLLAGMMIGLFFLEERDSGITEAYAVVPIGRSGYLSYRLLETGVLSIIFTAVAFLLLLPLLSQYTAAWGPSVGGSTTGYPVAVAGPWRMTAAAIAVLLPSALAGPLLALFLIICARDKVSGLALAKLSSFVILAVPAWYLIPGPAADLLQLVFSVPSFRAWLGLFSVMTARVDAPGVFLAWGGPVGGILCCTGAALLLEGLLLVPALWALRRSFRGRKV